MAAAAYLGDEVSAAGWRLAGLRTWVPVAGADAQALEQALDEARAQSSLVLVSAAVAVHLDAARLASAMGALSPLVVVLPDPQGVATPPDLAARLRAQLGLEG